MSDIGGGIKKLGHMKLSSEALTVANLQSAAEPGPRSPGAMSFNELVRELWYNWFILVLCLGTAVGIAFAIVENSTPKFPATMKVAPAESNFGALTGGGQNNLGSVGGLGLLAPLTGGRQQYDDYSHFLDLLHSVRLAEQLERRYGLMKEVFPYDSATNQYVPPSELLPRLVRFARSVVGLPVWTPPGPVEFADYLTDYLETDRHIDSSATITYRNSDPAKARLFLERAFTETDRLMRDEKLRTREEFQRYISDRLTQTAGLDQRSVLIQLWGTEETQRLLLTSGDPVGARMIDDVNVPNLPSADAAIVLTIAIVSGLSLGILIIIVRTAIKRA